MIMKTIIKNVFSRCLTPVALDKSDKSVYDEFYTPTTREHYTDMWQTHQLNTSNYKTSPIYPQGKSTHGCGALTFFICFPQQITSMDLIYSFQKLKEYCGFITVKYPNKLLELHSPWSRWIHMLYVN